MTRRLRLGVCSRWPCVGHNELATHSLIQYSSNLVAEADWKGNSLGTKLNRLPKNPGYLSVRVCCPAQVWGITVWLKVSLWLLISGGLTRPSLGFPKSYYQRLSLSADSKFTGMPKCSCRATCSNQHTLRPWKCRLMRGAEHTGERSSLPPVALLSTPSFKKGDFFLYFSVVFLCIGFIFSYSILAFFPDEFKQKSWGWHSLS